jgi:cobalt/nickel transport system permease protein
MYLVAFSFLAWAWWGIKKNHPRYIIPLIAVVSALLLVIQLFEFPVAGGGSSWHFLGGTAISMVLGPQAGILSMAITLIIQALMGDGGVTTWGANLFNMAAIGAMSFFIVKAALSRGYSTKRLAVGVFVASFLSNVATALAVGVEIGLFPMVGTLGGVAVTVPTMLMWYVPTGLFEGIVASSLIVALSKLRGVRLLGLESCRKPGVPPNKPNPTPG